MPYDPRTGQMLPYNGQNAAANPQMAQQLRMPAPAAPALANADPNAAFNQSPVPAAAPPLLPPQNMAPAAASSPMQTMPAPSVGPKMGGKSRRAPVAPPRGKSAAAPTPAANSRPGNDRMAAY